MKYALIMFAVFAGGIYANAAFSKWATLDMIKTLKEIERERSELERFDRLAWEQDRWSRR